MGKGSPSTWPRPDVCKDGSRELPIVRGMLKLEENNRLPTLDAFCASGELALSSPLRPVKGVLSIGLTKGRILKFEGCPRRFKL
jgi:predicted ATPase with chaperone activity